MVEEAEERAERGGVVCREEEEVGTGGSRVSQLIFAPFPFFFDSILPQNFNLLY